MNKKGKEKNHKFLIELIETFYIELNYFTKI